MTNYWVIKNRLKPNTDNFPFHPFAVFFLKQNAFVKTIFHVFVLSERDCLIGTFGFLCYSLLVIRSWDLKSQKAPL